jgi:DNA helicase IV
MTREEWAGKGWRIQFNGDEVVVSLRDGEVAFRGADAAHLKLRRRFFFRNLFCGRRRIVRLTGIKKSATASLSQHLRRLKYVRAVEEAVHWASTVVELLSRHLEEQRWIPAEVANRLLESRPKRGLLQLIHNSLCAELFDPHQLDSADFLESDVAAMIKQANEDILAAELTTRSAFFASVEKSPLTAEQAEAVVCFDNRVQVLAAAGSGKTSVIVSRAAYAVSRGFVSPDNILILAFNKAAASELQQRIKERFESVGIDSTGIRASTFHSFGLSVIGRGTGRKPRLANWLDQGKDLEKVMEIVDSLRDSSPSFRVEWDIYRLLFANAPTDLNGGTPDGFHREKKSLAYRTFSGVLVKSHGERLIANFLYLNGVEFEYEKSYVHPTADENNSEYHPDFYYPAIDVWHEHWAIDQNGNAPADFPGYIDSMNWKREQHQLHETKLIESTWIDVVFGDGLKKLQSDLEGFGLDFDWNPDREIRDPSVKPMKHEELARLIRTFMSHVKSNGFTEADLESRLGSDKSSMTGYRTRLFLNLYWQIHAGWESQLRQSGSVDYEDMLVEAAELLEVGRASFPYELIMVDEFQDSSRARARLVKGLVKEPGRYLLTVGDDWQSINRFAGSDVSIMTGFSDWFGEGPQLALTTTFRCAQTICDVARNFVIKNPEQLDKPMRSFNAEEAGSVTVVLSDDDDAALYQQLEWISNGVMNRTIRTDSRGKVSVDVLGRYGFQRDVLPENVWPSIDLTFRTVHGAKGLEADYVVVPSLTTGTYGFPSNIADDPVLALAMPTPEMFQHAEERRLFYVALTRARRGVFLIAPLSRMSPFVVELIQDPAVKVLSETGRTVIVCESCLLGIMLVRTGPYGQFLGCSKYPACTSTRNMPNGGPMQNADIDTDLGSHFDVNGN